MQCFVLRFVICHTALNLTVSRLSSAVLFLLFRHLLHCTESVCRHIMSHFTESACRHPFQCKAFVFCHKMSHFTESGCKQAFQCNALCRRQMTMLVALCHLSHVAETDCQHCRLCEKASQAASRSSAEFYSRCMQHLWKVKSQWMINENKEGLPPETEEYREGQAGWPALVSLKGLVAGLWFSGWLKLWPARHIASFRFAVILSLTHSCFFS